MYGDIKISHGIGDTLVEVETNFHVIGGVDKAVKAIQQIANGLYEQQNGGPVYKTPEELAVQVETMPDPNDGKYVEESTIGHVPGFQVADPQEG